MSQHSASPLSSFVLGPIRANNQQDNVYRTNLKPPGSNIFHNPAQGSLRVFRARHNVTTREQARFSLLPEMKKPGHKFLIKPTLCFVQPHFKLRFKLARGKNRYAVQASPYVETLYTRASKLVTRSISPVFVVTLLQKMTSYPRLHCEISS